MVETEGPSISSTRGLTLRQSNLLNLIKAEISFPSSEDAHLPVAGHFMAIPPDKQDYRSHPQEPLNLGDEFGSAACRLWKDDSRPVP